MKTLIVHIEFDRWQEGAINNLISELEGVFYRRTGGGETAGWRYFDSLEEAERWEETGEYSWWADREDCDDEPCGCCEPDDDA